MNSLKDKFTNIVENNKWCSGGEETPCGRGSTLRAIEEFNLVEVISDFIKEKEIRSIVDVGCGDFNWMRFVELHGATYLGYDIVKSLVCDNNERYSNLDGTIHFTECCGLEYNFTPADLLICKDVLFHQELSDVEKFLDQHLSRFKYALFSHHPDIDNTNRDINNGSSFDFLNLSSLLGLNNILWKKQVDTVEIIILEIRENWK